MIVTRRSLYQTNAFRPTQKTPIVTINAASLPDGSTVAPAHAAGGSGSRQ